jgi:hypothetical protein
LPSLVKNLFPFVDIVGIAFTTARPAKAVARKALRIAAIHSGRDWSREGAEIAMRCRVE